MSRLWCVGCVLLMVGNVAAPTAWGQSTSRNASPQSELIVNLKAENTKLDQAIAKSPDRMSLYSSRGDVRFFLGDFAGAVKDYEKMLDFKPGLADSHWRRGIALYYAKDYKAAAKQFERYHSYDNIDRENGIWRYFSQFKAHGEKTAKEGLLKYEKDDREPFPDVYHLFADERTPDQILDKIAASELSKTERAKREFYAHLYIGLDHALHGRSEKAKPHLQKSTANTWGKTAGFGPNYMWHVGRVQLGLLKKNEKNKPKDQVDSQTQP